MSIARLALSGLDWAELWSILLYLDNRELYIFGCTCRSAFVTFLREKELRKGIFLSLKVPPRFLGRIIDHEKVLLVSYPRCGNSYARKLLEAATGIVTGSDSRPNRPLAASLIRFGYVGEGITDQSVWIVKSHFPERLGFIRFPVKRVILVVRNPFDAIESYFHMGMTNTHDKCLSTESFASLTELWKEFVPNEAEIWTKFYSYWLEKMESLPILVIRYEDILNDELKAVETMIEFVKTGNMPQQHRWKTHWLAYREEKSLSSSCTDTIQGPGYQPKKKVVGKALVNSLSVEQVEQMRLRTLPLLASFGYQLEANNFESDGSDPASKKFMVKVDQNFSLASNGRENASFMINDKFEIRPESDNFGRKITDLRRKYTVDDTKPFATA